MTYTTQKSAVTQALFWKKIRAKVRAIVEQVRAIVEQVRAIVEQVYTFCQFHVNLLYLNSTATLIIWLIVFVQ